MNIRRMGMAAGVWVCLAGVPGMALAQQKTQSPAEAARKAKEQQKQASKVPVVWTNDNLPTAGTVNVVGQPAATSSTGTAAADPPATADPADPNTDKDKLAADLAAAQKDLDNAKTDLDLAQRESKLDSDQFYGMPDYASNQQGQAKLGADKSQVSAKQQAVDAAQKKVNDLQKQLDALNDKSKAETAAPKS